MTKNYYYLSEIVKTIISIIRIIKKSSFKNRIKKENHKEICYILGNGPSLIKEIKEISNSDTDYFAINLFANTEYYTNIKPKYYVIIDPILLMNSFLDHETSNLAKDLAHNIKEKTNWPLIFYMPSHINKNNFSDLIIENKNIEIKKFNLTNMDGNKYIKNLFYEHNIASPVKNNVLGAALYISIMKNYKNIYIYGADHSWTKDLFVNDKNQVCLVNTHFYDNEKVNGEPWKKANGDFFKMHEILLSFSTMFEAYAEIKSFADRQGVKIINATKDSFIDSFDKK